MNQPGAHGWKSWLRTMVGLVYPVNCQVCHAPLDEAGWGALCGACLARVRFIELPYCWHCALPFAGKPRDLFRCGYCRELEFSFERAVAACRAEGVVREVIHGFKYRRQMYYLPYLAAWLLGAARERIDWAAVDAIVPVPLHPRKRREREFNQAELLARSLGRALGVPVLANAVRRVKDTPSQTRLDADHRRRNLRGAFVARRPERIEGQRLVLVDDVFTTGVTLDSCARVLRDAGGQTITALTVARGV